MPAATDRRADSLGEIAADRSYPLPTFQTLAGLSAWAMRMARRDGLKVRTVGRRKYVIGRDWLEYLAKQ